MAEIGLFDFEIALRVAADRALRADAEEFDSLGDGGTEPPSAMPRSLVRAERREKRKKSRARKVFLASLASLACALFLCAGAVAASPVTVKWREMIVERFDEYWKLSFPAEEGEYAVYLPGYIPEGYSVTAEDYTLGDVTVVWSDGDGGEICYYTFPDRESGIMVDNDPLLEGKARAVIRGQETEITTLVYSSGYTYFIWSDDNAFYTLSANRLTARQLISVAESLEKAEVDTSLPSRGKGPEEYVKTAESVVPGKVAVSWSDGEDGYLEYVACRDKEDGIAIGDDVRFEETTHAVIRGEETEITVFGYLDNRLVFFWSDGDAYYFLSANKLYGYQLINIVEDLENTVPRLEKAE